MYDVVDNLHIRGRKITSKGRKDLDQIAGQVCMDPSYLCAVLDL